MQNPNRIIFSSKKEHQEYTHAYHRYLKEKWKSFSTECIQKGISPEDIQVDSYSRGKADGKLGQSVADDIRNAANKQAKLDAAIKLASTIGQANDVLGRVIERLLLKD